MTALIGAGLLLAWTYYAYRAARRLLAGDRTDNPVLDRLGRDVDLDLDLTRLQGTAIPDTAAEAREGELSRQVIIGRIDPASYQRQMNQLAVESEAQAGGRR